MLLKMLCIWCHVLIFKLKKEKLIIKNGWGLIGNLHLKMQQLLLLIIKAGLILWLICIDSLQAILLKTQSSVYHLLEILQRLLAACLLIEVVKTKKEICLPNWKKDKVKLNRVYILHSFSMLKVVLQMEDNF